jgi:hypothetical protein
MLHNLGERDSLRAFKHRRNPRAEQYLNQNHSGRFGY